MKKFIRIILLLLIVSIIALAFYAGRAIKTTLLAVGPKALGVPLEVGKVDVRPIRGIIRIHDLKIGNPEGFQTDNLFTMQKLNIDVSIKSLFTDTIIVNTVEIIGPEITYEKTLTTSNIEAFQDHLSGEEKEPSEKDEEKDQDKESVDTEEKKSGKKVVIEYFVLDDCKVHLSMTGMMGTAVPLTLSKIEMRDIGKEEGSGASIGDITGIIFGSILSSVGNLALGSVKLIGTGTMAVGGAAVDGVSAVGGVAVDGVSAVGGAAVGGVAAVGKGVVGLFGGGSDDDKNEDNEEAEKNDEKASE